MPTKSHKNKSRTNLVLDKKRSAVGKIIKSHMVAGAGVLAAGAAAAVAGTLFLYGKNAKHNRKKVRGWAVKIKGEVLDEMVQMAKMNQKAYHALIDQVSRKYAVLKHVDPNELEQMAKELKGHWKHISAQLAQTKSSAKPSGKKRPHKGRK